MARSGPLPNPKVVVYVKPGCTLCEPLLETVEKVREEIAFDLEKVDISGDPQLMQKYKNEIPVVTVDGRKAFKGRLTAAAFAKRLEKAREQAANPAGPAIDEAYEEQFVPPRPIALGLVALAIGLFGWFLLQGFRDAQEGRGRLAAQLLRTERRNDQPPAFHLESMSSGKKIGLDDFRGKIVFLNFWATWCPPCVEEMPSLLRLGERMKSDPRLVMLAVSADESWTPVRQFWAGKPPPPFEVLLDPSGKIAKEYGTTMFPETYVIVNGRIIGFIEGPRDWDKWFADEYLHSVE